MSDILSDEDAGALAAEYVLGTLNAEERNRANALLDVDGSFRGMVRIWERWLGDLHLMVEPVEPPTQIWERIKSKMEAVKPSVRVAPPAPETKIVEETPAQEVGIAASPAAAPAATAPETGSPAGEATAPAAETPTQEKPAEPAEPAAEASAETTLDALEAELRKSGLLEGTPAAPPVIPPPRLPDTVTRERSVGPERPRAYVPPDVAREAARDLRPALRRWRVFAMLVTLILAAGGGLLAAWRYVPDRLPPELRANVVLDYLKVFPPPPTPPPRPKPPPESQFDE